MELFHSLIFPWINFVCLGGGLVDGTKRGHWWKRPIPCQFHATIVTLSETRDQPVVADGAFVTTTIIIAVVAAAVVAIVVVAANHQIPTTNCLSSFRKHRQYNQTEMIQLHLFHRCRRRTPPFIVATIIITTTTTTTTITVSASATATAGCSGGSGDDGVGGDAEPAGWQNNNNKKNSHNNK